MALEVDGATPNSTFSREFVTDTTDSNVRTDIMSKLEVISEKLGTLDTVKDKLVPLIEDLIQNWQPSFTRMKNVSKDFNQYRQFDSDQLEECGSCLTTWLKNGKTIAIHYPICAGGGDIDALVAGTINQENVIVFAEAKHSIASKAACKNAKSDLYKGIRFWKELRELDRDALENKWHGINVERLRGKSKAEYSDDLDLLKAYKDLMVEKHKNDKIYIAFASSHFPDYTEEYLTELNLHYPYLRVVSKADGKLHVCCNSFQ